MSIRNLRHLLEPRSVAVIGASDRPGSLGNLVMRNLLKGTFSGPIRAVNLRHDTVAGQRAYRTVKDLPEAPDLAILCTPLTAAPQLIGELGAKGTRAAIVLGAGDSGITTAMLQAAKPYLLRILGPNCVGLLLPRIGLNASFAHTDALPGNLAFIAQSGALTTALLDWARGMQIGFSHFVSLGNAADVDFGDLLDHFADDPHTEAILLYIESITHARKFMSAARAAARNKPVIVVKAGREPEGAKAATSHTGALTGADDVYDAAFRRAGMLRVDTTRELFDAAETLARLKPLGGERLAIVSNGGGPAVMATDALVRGGGVLACLGQDSIKALDAQLPGTWSRANPVDIIGDAPVQRYVEALEAVLADPGVDATLLIHAPTAIVPPTDIAEACVPVLQSAARPTLTCWMGSQAVARARETCNAAGVPTYSTPEEAVGGFLQAVRFKRNQQQLMEVPDSVAEVIDMQYEQTAEIIARVLAEGRSVLTEVEAKDLLATYDIPTVKTRVVADIEALPAAAEGLGFPLVLKILSPDITHKSDVGGVALDITSLEDLAAAATRMLASCREQVPSARLTGFTLQPMIKRPNARELIAGIAVDPTFGPIALFGQGGIAVEVIDDKAVALLPLNTSLASDLISRTRIERLLHGYRDRPAVDRTVLEQTLVQLSQLAVDHAEIIELDINPLLVDEQGVIALDARVVVAPATARPADRLAIRPYPKELEEAITFHGRKVLLRPIRPEDLPLHRRFMEQIAPEDLQAYSEAITHVPSRFDLARFTQIDYERVMVFIALTQDAGTEPEILGMVRGQADPDKIEADFAVLVRPDCKAKGLGAILLRKLIGQSRDSGLGRLVGTLLADNTAMLRLAAECGFRIGEPQDGSVRVTLALRR